MEATEMDATHAALILVVVVVVILLVSRVRRPGKTLTWTFGIPVGRAPDVEQSRMGGLDTRVKGGEAQNIVLSDATSTQLQRERLRSEPKGRSFKSPRNQLHQQVTGIRPFFRRAEKGQLGREVCPARLVANFLIRINRSLPQATRSCCWLPLRFHQSIAINIHGRCDLRVAHQPSAALRWVRQFASSQERWVWRDMCPPGSPRPSFRPAGAV